VKCCSLDNFKSPPTTKREMGGHTLPKTQIGILEEHKKVSVQGLHT
jgi:hypothetical protein